MLARRGQLGQFPGGVHQRLAMAGAQHVAGQPAQAGLVVVAQRQAIAFVGHFDERLDIGRRRVLHQVFENPGDGRQRGFVADQQDLADPCRRLPFVAAGVAAEGFVGHGHLQAVADLGLSRPARRRAGDSVQHEIHVQLRGLGAQGADGVGAHRRLLRRRQLAPGRVPVTDARQFGRQAVGSGKQQLDALVRRQGAGVGDVLAGEHEARHAGAEADPLLELDIDQAVGARLLVACADQFAQAVCQRAV